MSNILGDLIGSVLSNSLSGGRAQSPAGGLGDLLGGLLGGGQAPMQQAGGHSVGGVSLAALLPVAMALLQQSGGIDGLLNKFRQAGYQKEADSWQSTGENEPIDAGALQSALGPDLGGIAQQFGLDGKQAAGGLAAVLPELLNQLTPQGKVEAQHENVVGDLLGMLTRR